jgi:hypothetical protein
LLNKEQAHIAEPTKRQEAEQNGIIHNKKSRKKTKGFREDT